VNHERTILLLAALASAASAQPFIEIGVSGSLLADDGVRPVTVRAIFDTSAPPISADATAVRFRAIDGDFIFSFDVPADAPMVNLDNNAEGIIYDLVYDQTNDRIRFEFGNFFGSRTGKLVISPIVGPMSASMNSLPDDPSAYMMDASASDRSMSLEYTRVGLAPLKALWTPSGFVTSDSAFSVWVDTAQDPNPDPCFADLTGDGQLDFFDLSAYLQLLQAGCP